MSSRRSTCWCATVIGGMMLALGACTPARNGAATDGASATQTSGSRDAWPFWPVRMRIHPLTRLTRDAEGPIIDLRLEFFDEAGDTTRCSGEAVIELVALPDEPASTGGVIAMQWNLDLRDLQVNRTHFDDITRTYLIRLRPGEAGMPASSEVRATLRSANGAVLRASSRLQ